MEWQFSSGWRIHWIDDGTIYKDKYHLWDIINYTPYGMVNQYYKQGYDLYHKGNFVQHGKTVKVLKAIVHVLTVEGRL